MGAIKRRLPQEVGKTVCSLSFHKTPPQVPEQWPKKLPLIHHDMTKSEAQSKEAEFVDPDGRSDHHDVGSAVQLAQQVEEERLSPWTPRMLRLYLVLSVAYLCGCLVSISGHCCAHPC